MDGDSPTLDGVSEELARACRGDGDIPVFGFITELYLICCNYHTVIRIVVSYSMYRMYVCVVSIRPQTITKCSGVLSAAGRDTTT